MDDVSAMAINRGLTKRGKDRTTLQALCKDQGWHLKKPQHVRVGTCFASTKGSLSEEALIYCALDVEAPLLLHSIYLGYPDLTAKMTQEPISCRDVIDIMSASPRAVDPIAKGRVKKITGIWTANSMKLRKDQVLIEVTHVYQARGVIHYPCDATNIKKCKCGRATHGIIRNECNFYLYSQFGPPPFLVVELKSRLRRYNDLTQYPKCIYADDGDIQQPTVVIILVLVYYGYKY